MPQRRSGLARSGCDEAGQGCRAELRLAGASGPGSAAESAWPGGPDWLVVEWQLAHRVRLSHSSSIALVTACARWTRRGRWPDRP